MEQLQQQQREKAVVVGVNVNDRPDFAYSMDELRELAAACNVEVVDMLSQNAERVNPTHYLGTGKVRELASLLEASGAETAIFNDELSPSQIRNLEAELERKVVDRTMLILDIFAERAKTREAQLQVEVARLEYMLPRLVGLRESLGRQGGGAGLRNRGAGETKLELDRRRIEGRIAVLHEELEKLVARRQVQRKQRKKQEVPVVCLVGYTNAGKSSLMNAIIEMFHPESEKQVLAKDMLFATLETSVRSIELPDRKSFLLTDTVGFVSGLPHHLVKAFRSTLEEVSEADLLVHVVDYSNPEFERQIQVTTETLKELGAERISTVFAYNKTDLVGGETYPRTQGDIVYMSVKQRLGVDQLLAQIQTHVFGDYIRCEAVIPYDQGKVTAYFNEHAHVISTEYEEAGTRLTLECRLADFVKYRDAFVEARTLEG